MLFWTNILIDFSITDIFNFGEIHRIIQDLKKTTIPSFLKKFTLERNNGIYISREKWAENQDP